MNLRYIFTGLLICVTAAGCKKFEENTYHGKIRNNTGRDLTLDFYANDQDYANNTNILKSLSLPAYTSVEIPQEFDGGQKLYLDWYSADFTNTNWGLDPTFTVANITKEMDPAMTINTRNTAARLTWLNGNKTSTTWKAYNAFYSFSSNGSVWNQLTANQRDRQIVVRKNMTGTYTYKDNLGMSQTMEFTCLPSSLSGSTAFTNMYLNFGVSGSSSFYSFNPQNVDGLICRDTAGTSYDFPPFGSASYAYYYYRVP